MDVGERVPGPQRGHPAGGGGQADQTQHTREPGEAHGRVWSIIEIFVGCFQRL